MSVTKFLIEHLATAIAGGAEFSAMKTLVQDLESTTLSGPEKKAKVLEDFYAIGYGIAGWTINLLLELAVAYIKL